MIIEMEGQQMAPDWSSAIMQQLSNLTNMVNELRGDVSLIRGKLEASSEAQNEKIVSAVEQIKDVRRKLEACQDSRQNRDARIAALEQRQGKNESPGAGAAGGNSDANDSKYNAKLIIFFTSSIIILLELLRAAIGKI